MKHTHNLQIINGSWIKIIAMLSMVIDHCAGFVLNNYNWVTQSVFDIGKLHVSCMFVCRGILGRLAFPLFAFLLVEGFVHTKNFKRYLWTMIGWAVITQPFFNLMKGISWYVYWDGLNVLFTLSLALVAMKITEHKEWHFLKRASLLLLILVSAYVLRTDYGTTGVCFIILTKELRGRMDLELAALLGCFLKKWPFVGLSWIVMAMYNGKRGFIHGNVGKYICYSFYPLHMFAIWAIRTYLI